MTCSVEAFADAFMIALSERQKERMRWILSDGGVVSPRDLKALPALVPLTGPGGAGTYRIRPEIYDVMRHIDFGERPAKRLVREITEKIACDQLQDAFEMVLENGGAFISMTLGLENAEQIANGFAGTLYANKLPICLLEIVNALKAGNLGKADTLVARLQEHVAVPLLEECGPDYDPALVCVLFMKAVYADEPVSETASQKLFGILSELSGDASLMRGVLYNVGLDVLLRRKQVEMAEEAALRALYHYEAAGKTGLGFYVHLYLSLIAVWRGDFAKAQRRVSEAREALQRFEAPTANDELLLRYFDLICRYETGAPDGLIQHLTCDETAVPFGELWPAMAQQILSYGRRALSSHVSAAAALSWVRRWRVRQWRSQRFDGLISVQEALALQDMGRWQEADEVLSTVAGQSMADFRIARLRSALDRMPGSEEVGRKARQAVEFRDQSLRHRMDILMIAVDSAISRGTDREAVRLLGTAVRDASPTDIPMFWLESRDKVGHFLRQRVLRTELKRMPQLRRTLMDIARESKDPTPQELTRQEYRVLLLLGEGLSNKIIGQRLGVTLPTVKFHVKNLCRKSKTNSRKDVVQYALRAGWLNNLQA